MMRPAGGCRGGRLYNGCMLGGQAVGFRTARTSDDWTRQLCNVNKAELFVKGNSENDASDSHIVTHIY